MGENGYRKQVMEVYRFISDHLYFNRADLEVKGERFNSVILFSLLTALKKGKQLVIGEPGLGKTTSAEFVCSLVYEFPLGVIWGSEVSGHPEQTEEKIIGRPDLGKLNQGEEDVAGDEEGGAQLNHRRPPACRTPGWGWPAGAA